MHVKGQAAMEFLMTYGWAILVVLAAIGALAYFGILSPSKFLPNSFTITGGISPGQYKVSSSTGLTFTIINNLGVDANITTIAVDTRAGSDVSCVDAGMTTTPNQYVGNGAQLTFTDANCKGTAGQKFKADVNVTYIRSGETVNHMASGSITASVEQ
jgi:hypothetical protein